MGRTAVTDDELREQLAQTVRAAARIRTDSYWIADALLPVVRRAQAAALRDAALATEGIVDGDAVRDVIRTRADAL